MTVQARALLLRRNWVPVIACGVLFVVGLLVTRMGEPAALFGYFAAWFGLIFGPTFVLRNAFPKGTPTTLLATASGIEIEAYGNVPSEDILEAKLIPRRRDAVVELAIRDRAAIALRMDPGEAKAIVDLLGARRTQFRLVLPYGSRLLATFVVLASVALLLGRGEAAAWLVALPGCFVFALPIAWIVGLLRGRLVVGADGFTTRWAFRNRFIAFRDVAAVKGNPRPGGSGTADTFVVLNSGRNVKLRTLEAPNTEEERGAESRAMLSHVQEAFEKSTRLNDASVNVPSLVERGSRSAREWLSGLDALVRGGGSRYRVAAVSAEMLSDLAKDPGATIESRIGAAAALVRMDDEELRTRVRIAAEGCAESELRDTLLALSDARDDATTEAALASLRR